MPHLTDDQLALLAVDGEPALSRDDALHLASCPACQRERAAYAEITAALRDPVALVRPSEDVWARIAAELDLDDVAAPPAADDAAPGPQLAVVPRPAPTPASDDTDNVIPLRRPGGRPWIRRIALAAAASFALGVGSMAAFNALTSGPASEIVQATGLDPLPGWDTEGQATLKRVDGELVLVVELPETDVDGYREVWLIDRNVERLVSLGTMNGERGEFTIPAGLDLDEYVIVDVSREDFDGNPTHSGDSIVRGTFA